MDTAPYISIVVTSRNDNHGDKLLFRMQTFVDCLLDQCKRYQLPAELVIVEWNPPDDRPPLAQALRWPGNDRHCRVRIIQVPSRIHRRFQHSDKLGLFQMIAKNVGIRRARAPFVLATNIDILFSEELMTYLSSRQLQSGLMYRIDRFDVPADLPVNLPVNRLLDFCRENVIRVHTRWGSRDAKTGQYYDGSARWKLMIRDLAVLLSGKVSEKRLHTNASGDFMLLAKADWLSIRGYPELQLLSMHVDGLGCQIAHFSGARERVLARPLQIYHIEHSTGSGWVPEGDGALRAMAKSAVPGLAYSKYRELAIRMRKERRPIILNEEDWGLADEQLPEMTVC